MTDSEAPVPQPPKWQFSASGTMVQPSAGRVTFYVPPQKEVMRVEPDGTFYVHGEKVDAPEAVRDAFARWVAQWTGNPVVRPPAVLAKEMCALQSEQLRGWSERWRILMAEYEKP